MIALVNRDFSSARGSFTQRLTLGLVVNAVSIVLCTQAAGPTLVDSAAQQGAGGAGGGGDGECENITVPMCRGIG